MSIAISQRAAVALTARAAWSFAIVDHTVDSMAGEGGYLERLAAAIVQLRALRGMSQAQLAEAVGRSEAAVSRWETAKAMPKAIDLVRMSQALNAPPEILLDPPPLQTSPVAERLAEDAAARAVAEGPDEQGRGATAKDPRPSPTPARTARRGR